MVVTQFFMEKYNWSFKIDQNTFDGIVGTNPRCLSETETIVGPKAEMSGPFTKTCSYGYVNPYKKNTQRRWVFMKTIMTFKSPFTRRNLSTNFT